MIYRLIPQNGDSVPVPQLVFSSLTRADENCIRVALYLLRTGCTEPKAIAHDLGLKSIPAAERALQWWAGAGLLEKERGTLPSQPAPEIGDEVDLLATLRDPKITTLMDHAQAYLGKTLSDGDSRRLVELYTVGGYPVDVILLCISHLAGKGSTSLSAVKAELTRWRKAGVKTGEDAEKHLKLELLRQKRLETVAGLLHLSAEDFTLGERSSIKRWFETWHFDEVMVEEALRYINQEKNVWHLNDVLKTWHTKGWATPAEVRAGSIYGSNVRVDKAPVSPAASGKNPLLRNLGKPLNLKPEE